MHSHPCMQTHLVGMGMSSSQRLACESVASTIMLSMSDKQTETNTHHECEWRLHQVNICGPVIQNCPFRETIGFTAWLLVFIHTKSIKVSCHEGPSLDIWQFILCSSHCDFLCMCWLCSSQKAVNWGILASFSPVTDMRFEWFMSSLRLSALMCLEKQKQFHCKHWDGYCFDIYHRLILFLRVCVCHLWNIYIFPFVHFSIFIHLWRFQRGL